MPFTIEVTDAIDRLTLQLRGEMDGEAGALLLAAVAAVSGEKTRVTIDLRAVSGFTPQGVARLAECRRAGPGKLTYVTGRGIGRQALLAALEAARDTSALDASSS